MSIKKKKSFTYSCFFIVSCMLFISCDKARDKSSDSVIKTKHTSTWIQVHNKTSDMEVSSPVISSNSDINAMLSDTNEIQRQLDLYNLKLEYKLMTRAERFEHAKAAFASNDREMMHWWCAKLRYGSDGDYGPVLKLATNLLFSSKKDKDILENSRLVSDICRDWIVYKPTNNFARPIADKVIKKIKDMGDILDKNDVYNLLDPIMHNYMDVILYYDKDVDKAFKAVDSVIGDYDDSIKERLYHDICQMIRHKIVDVSNLTMSEKLRIKLRNYAEKLDAEQKAKFYENHGPKYRLKTVILEAINQYEDSHKEELP